MPQFYAFSFVILLATLVWLWRQGHGRTRFGFALLGLLLLEGVQFVVAMAPISLPEVLDFWLRWLAWGVLLWSLAVSWTILLAGLSVTALLHLLALWPVADMLAWGYVTAVPLLAFVFILRRRVNFPIVATATAPSHPVVVNSQNALTAEMINNQQPILECLADGVLVCGDGGHILTVNQAALDILSKTENEIIGQPVTAVLTDLPLTGGAKSRRFQLNERTIEGQMNLIYDLEGAVQGTVVVLQDITAEHKANQARETFLTTVSHELRTPLTAIKGYVELLKSGTGGELNESQMAFMDTIQRNVTRVVQLINSLIFASSVKGGRQEYQPGYANLPQLIGQICRELKPQAQNNQLQIHTEVDGRLHLIEIDPIHLATILEELIGNAIKYSRPGGSVTVSAFLESETFAVIRVTDTGIGIEPTDQSHIFEEFYRPEQRDEHVRTEGIGMGLSIVRALIEAYNGRIWLDSTPDKGSTFTFILSTRQSENPFPPTKSESP